jgi:hypothetical protein
MPGHRRRRKITGGKAAVISQSVEDNAFHPLERLYSKIELSCDLPRLPAAIASQGAALG